MSSLYMAQSLLKSLLIKIRRNGRSVVLSSSSSYSNNYDYRLHSRSFIVYPRNQGDGIAQRIKEAVSEYSTAATNSNSRSNRNTSDSDEGWGSSREFLAMTDEQLMSQCEMDTFKASGPGGQHRNKRESAVRLKHLPTGIVAQAVEDRSQHRNRAAAIARLRTLLALKV